VTDEVAHDGTTTDRYTPAQVPGLTGITQISIGGAGRLALRSDGTVRAWGGNGSGQLGNGNTTDRVTPAMVPGLTGITQVAAGEYYSVALRFDGTVLCPPPDGPSARSAPRQPQFCTTS
jgi:alpha-tubulin suppressor-like RCC1 family protein